MTSVTCIINVFSPSLEVSGSNTIHKQVRDCLNGYTGCTVLGAGRSCVDFSASDIEVRFQSKAKGIRIIEALRATFYKRCEIDIDWL